MLVIGPPAEAAYYWEKGTRGRWLGSGLSGLGLTGEPSPNDLRQLLHGRDRAGQPLWPSADRRRRLGHDLVFAAPKAISLLWALGAPDVTDAIAGAHDAAVDGAFAYLERRAAWVRRGPTGELVPTRGLSAAAFRHRVSRAGDPHLHSHVVVANAACDLDGAWSSLDGRWLFAEQRAAGALYQAALRHRLETAGLQLRWRVRPDGLGIVEDVADEVTAAFSRRRRQLLDEARARGDTARRPGRLAGLVTRPVRPVDDRSSEWAQRARAIGFDATRFRIRPASAAAPPPASPTKLPSADQVLGADGVTARRALFTRRDVVRALAARLPQGASPEAIEARADEILASAAVVRVTPAEPAILRPRLAPRYTTPELVSLEHRLVTEAQRAAHLGSTTVITARPGPETWVALDAARAGWSATHPQRPAIALVPSATEAREFETATGIDAYLVGDGPSGVDRAIVVVPGAQRLGSRGIAAILDRAAARGDFVVLIDGSRRPAALEGRDLLSRLAALGGERRPSMQPLTGPPVRLDQLQRPGGSVTLCADSASRYQAAVEDWATARSTPGARLEARHWSDVEDLNRRARALVSPPGPSVQAGGREYCAGEPVFVRRSSPRLGLTRGRTGTVVAADAQRQRLHILFGGDQQPVELKARQLAPTVLSHAYAVPASSRQPRAGPVFTIDARPHVTGGQTEVHHYLVAAHGLSTGHGLTPRDPLARLARVAGPSLSPVRAGSHVELTATRLLLDAYLRASLPPGGADRARLQAGLDNAQDERDAAQHWVAARLPGAGARLAEANDVLRRHERELARLDAWITDHHPELRDLAGLDQALSRRTELIGRAAELLPERGVVATLGPPPADPSERRAWRTAAVELETGGHAVRHRVAQRLVNVRTRDEHRRAAGICLP